MLIDFTVENYRSIKEPVTLSAIAASSRKVPASERRRRHTKSDSDIAEPYEVTGRGFSLLPVLGIFGANASGKTNVLMALDDLLGAMIVHGLGVFSPDFTGHMVTPFLLSGNDEEAPTCFALRVLVDGVIFTYYLDVGRSRILHERLEQMPAPPLQNRLLFDRRWDASSQEYVWQNGPSFKGAHTQVEHELNEQHPFASILLHTLKVQSLLGFAEWVKTAVSGGLRYNSVDQWGALRLMYEDAAIRARVDEMMQQFDTGLMGLEVKQHKTLGYSVTVRHEIDGEVTLWPLTEESAGTQQLFLLAYHIIRALDNGGMLICDEIEKHLHPRITRSIIQVFQNRQSNPHRSQLIFTSHDNILLSHQLLRRDQLWFTSKRADHSTKLYSLSDFKDRNDRDIARSYIDGRYGAVPILPPTEYIVRRDIATELAV